MSFIFLLIGCEYRDQNQKHTSLISETDATGTQVRLERYPERIVSASPNNTEILLELGLREKLVGVSAFYGYPERVQGIERIGGYINPNVEKIMAIEPDIVFAARGNPSKIIETLRKNSIKVFAVDIKGLDDLFEAILQIGRLTDREDNARAIVEKMRTELKRAQQFVAKLKDEQKPRVLWLGQESPLSAAGPDNMIDELIRRAGGKNAAGQQKSKWPTINVEKLLLLDPQIIILGEERYRRAPDKVAKTISRWQGDFRWRNIAAVAAGNVYFVPTDFIGQPSPRNIDGLKRLIKIFHPDIFSELYEKE